MNDNTPTYRLSGVGKSYGKGGGTVAALRGIDIQFERGEYTVVAGASGSGKSTLLQLLGALDTPTSGTIEFEGRDLGRLGEGEQADLRREALGFVFQQFNLIPTLTAAENVEAALEGAGLRSNERRARSRELLGRVGLADRARHLPSQLSGGEQQRVAIARALANEPRVLLADEPTGNLDSSTGEAILELIRGLWLDEGLTVVLITHDPAITAGAPRVVRLQDGEVVESETLAPMI
jgi:putative ABC transport system ATP-binding protein